MDVSSQQQTHGQKAKVKIRLKGAGQEPEASHAGSQLGADASPSQQSSQAAAPSRVSIRIKQPSSRLGQSADTGGDISEPGLPPAKRIRSSQEPSIAAGGGFQDAIYVSDGDDAIPVPIRVKTEAAASQQLNQQYSMAGIKAESKPTAATGGRIRVKPGAKVEKKEEKKGRIKSEGAFGYEGELEDHISGQWL
jgi:hypothetical protein